MSVLRQLAAAALVTVLMHAGASAQIMRFETSVGNFDMELNPTHDPNLQPLVDNMVAYIGLGRYNHSAINRAVEGNAGTADDFVLQMGGLMAFPTSPQLWAALSTQIEALTPVTVDANSDGQVDFSALANTRGTVSLALRSGQPNSGTSSFFINLNDNSSILDSQGFVPFARIADLTTITKIMQLTQTDLSDEIGQTGNATYTDVPLTDTNEIVVLENIRVLQADANFSFVGPIASALQLAQRNGIGPAPSADSLSSEADLAAATLADSLDATAIPAAGPAAVSAPAVVSTPEPASATLAAFAALAALHARRRFAA